MKQENQNSYFLISITLDNSQRNEFYKEKIDNSIDLVYAAIGVSHEENFVFKSQNKHVHIFKTAKRKRKGQIVKFCERFLPEGQEFKIIAGTKDKIYSKLYKLKQQNEYNLTYSQEKEYKGEDLEIFENEDNWYEWQKEFYDMIIDKKINKIKPPHSRHIIHLVDFEGCSGKSLLFKKIQFEFPEIGRLTYGTASQLRTGIVNMGPRSLYLIDLTRSRGKNEAEEDLLACLEDTKNGLVVSSMYGSGKHIMMLPPTIVVASNYLFDINLLSRDRWEVYEITKNKKLGRKNALIKDERKRKTKKKSEELYQDLAKN